MKNQEIDNLKYRYLLWLYKTVKEEFDRVERKFTQVDIDREIQRQIVKSATAGQIDDQEKFNQLVRDWEQYVEKKEQDGRAAKFDGKKLKPEYYFLTLKLEAVEKLIKKFFGGKALEEIKAAYEDEMRKRIIESKEHT